MLLPLHLTEWRKHQKGGMVCFQGCLHLSQAQELFSDSPGPPFVSPQISP